MPRCPHCKGTGEAPIKLQQECVGCQRKMTVVFETHEDMVRYDGLIYCRDCKPSGDREKTHA
jgi:hypothetical protein